MANLGCLLLSAFGKFLAPVLVTPHTVHILDPGNDKRFEDKDYKSD